ncbi:MAG: transketolase [Candidatus Algichlamydia australiensis]|nr:transketolase [Chlamydiales bacterium]
MQNQNQILHKIADAIRLLTIDAVEKAGSGHPGLPLGCAEIGAYLFGEFLNFDSTHPSWPERDRLILSAGHGSLWLYSCLHLAGFPISISDLKKYRQIDSNTPSHPDITKTDGVEATTGLDGQGISFAVGQALALKKIGVESKVVVLAGDGDLMEGVSYEACSLAGHLNLNNLILVYDCNKTTLDGYVSETFSENISLRFQSQNWNFFEVDGHDIDQIRKVISPLRVSQKRPTIIVAHTQIGYGSPNKAKTPLAHGNPLGTKEAFLTKKILGLSTTPFHVNPEIYTYFQNRQAKGFSSSKIEIPQNLEALLEQLEIPSPTAGRWASHKILQLLKQHLPMLNGGSADLASSDGTYLDDENFVTSTHFAARNIKYGVREFAMASMAAGMAKTDSIIPFIGTFLAFTDYMKSAIRMSAIMKLRVIYQFTHDSIFIGHDGPTHQPIEHLASLRAIPGLIVIRPADAHEVKMAWIVALRYQGPSAIILSRQPLPALSTHSLSDGLGRGAYIIKHESSSSVEHLLIATGSEVSLALEIAKELGEETRVVSMPSWELFEKQPLSYKRSLLQGKIKISIEAGIDQGWHKYIGSNGLAISIETFGESGSPDELAKRFGYTKNAIIEKIRSHARNSCYKQ